MRLTRRDIGKLPPEYQAQIRAALALPVAILEQCAVDAVKQKNEVQAFNTPVNINIHSKRKRECDPDGISAKWAIDSLVNNGLLINDSAKHVKSITYTQEKSDIEETIITIEEV